MDYLYLFTRLDLIISAEELWLVSGLELGASARLHAGDLLSNRMQSDDDDATPDTHTQTTRTPIIRSSSLNYCATSAANI